MLFTNDFLLDPLPNWKSKKDGTHYQDNKVKRDSGNPDVHVEVDVNDLESFADEKKDEFSESKLKNIMKLFKQDTKIKKEDSDREYDRFTSSITDYGSGDISTAVSKFSEVGLNGNDLADQVREWADSTDTDLNDVDICYVAYDYILQTARGEIDSILDFDIINDIVGGAEFSVHGNYMASSYDYSEEAVEQLRNKLLEASDSELKQLSSNIFVKSFLNDVGIFDS